MKTIEIFESENLEKEELFNSMAKNIFGGDTQSNGHTTTSSGADEDDETSDEDDDAAGGDDGSYDPQNNY